MSSKTSPPNTKSNKKPEFDIIRGISNVIAKEDLVMCCVNDYDVPCSLEPINNEDQDWVETSVNGKPFRKVRISDVLRGKMILGRIAAVGHNPTGETFIKFYKLDHICRDEEGRADSLVFRKTVWAIPLINVLFVHSLTFKPKRRHNRRHQ